jgi:UDP-N-acetylmuramoylalanine--D-glutamate ligase
VSGAERARAEVAVIGLARSGRAAAALLARRGRRVYGSDAGTGAELEATGEWLRARGVDVQLGGHDLQRVRAASLLVVSPGVAPDAPPLPAAREAGVPVVSEIAVALEALPDAKVIAVTGTNGKSTVTALVAHIMTSLGRHAAAAGNIGQALSELALGNDPPEWLALEMSSFQLHDTPGFAPRVGVLTNLSPDHLDRYASADEYYADKALMFAAATDRSRWVTNADDAVVRRMTTGVPGRHYRFSLAGRADAYYDSARQSLLLFEEPLCERTELSLLGGHNVANALAAALAVAAGDDGRRDRASASDIGAALKTFRGLPHRLEIVSETNGVRWINDSKATNVASARTAIAAMDRPAILLLGGRHKGEPYTALAPEIATHVRHVIAYGEAAPLIAGDLSAAGVKVDRAGSDFAEVITRAARAAQPGDAVLLAPACSSFDMFRDYEERGTRFRELVTGR